MTITNFPARHILLALCAAFSLCGCLSQPPQRNLAQAPKEVAPEIEPAPALPPYRLQVGDVLDVKLMLNPELNDQVTVRPDGYISTAVTSDVPAYGRTPAELQQDLESRYSGQLVNPKVSVIVRSFAPNRVYVTGEVNTPGEYVTVGPNLTLLQAIARAGGVKNSAGTGQIIIVRRGLGDKPAAYAADYMSAASGNDPSSDVRLAPYDVVYVPRSGVGDAYLHFQQYLQQFVPVAFGLNYELNTPAVVR